LARHHEAQQDTELVTLREEMALTVVRICVLLSQLETGEAGEPWLRLRKAHTQLQKARQRGDHETASQALQDIEQLIEQGASDTLVWKEIYILINQRRRQVESEWKRLGEMQQIMTREQALTLIDALMTGILEAVRGNITDGDLQRKVLADAQSVFDRHLGGADQSPIH
jgi:hypothetical protein